MLPSSGSLYSAAFTKNMSAAALRRSWRIWPGSIARSTDSSIVSSEYNYGIPPALKNLLDHFLEEYFFGHRRSSVIPLVSSAEYGPRWSCA
jgi:hypothetical protein